VRGSGCCYLLRFGGINVVLVVLLKLRERAALHSKRFSGGGSALNGNTTHALAS
jgi:hypothetical protein